MDARVGNWNVVGGVGPCYYALCAPTELAALLFFVFRGIFESRLSMMQV